MWVGTSQGLFSFEGQTFAKFPKLQGGDIVAIAGDGSGNVWISNNDDGLLFVNPQDAVRRIPWARFGRKYAAVALLPDRLHGGVWLGFAEGGIAYSKDGQIRSSYNAAEGLGQGEVTDLQLGSDGAVWAETEGGLSRERRRRLNTFECEWPAL